MNYLQSGCLCNIAFAMATPGLLGFVTSPFPLQFHFLLINNGRRGFLITKQDALKHITMTDVVAIDTAKTLNGRRASEERERATGKINKRKRERSSSAAFATALKLESLKLKFGRAQLDS